MGLVNENGNFTLPQEPSVTWVNPSEAPEQAEVLLQHIKDYGVTGLTIHSVTNSTGREINVALVSLSKNGKVIMDKPKNGDRPKPILFEKSLLKLL